MCRARVIATWRIGLRVPLIAHNYKMGVTIRYLRGLSKMDKRSPAVQKNDCGTKSEGGKNFSAHISVRCPHDLNAWKTLTFALFRL